LDHEHHEISEKHEPAGAAMYQAILRLAGDIAPFDYAQGRLRQCGRFSIFFTKNSLCEFFCEKETKVPCSRRRFCRSPGETSGLHVNRVTCVK
jgi:hypothetical protein